MGLACGFGAASADATYGFLAAAGLVATGLLQSHAELMQIAGGVLITVLGLMALRRFRVTFNRPGIEPQKHEDRPKSGRKTLGAFLSTFSLTLTNPMTIVTFLGLISGLGAGATGTAIAPSLLVLGVFVGSALWWLCLVQTTLSFGRWLRPSATRCLDLISGLVLTAWGLWIVTGY